VNNHRFSALQCRNSKNVNRNAGFERWPIAHNFGIWGTGSTNPICSQIIAIFWPQHFMQFAAQFGILLGGQVAFKNAILHSLTKAFKNFGNFRAPFINRNIVGDQVQHTRS